MFGEDIRWKQRFQNFVKAVALLEKAMCIHRPDVTQKAGTIQFFEMCTELAWKLLKDYLEEQGFSDVNSPRSAVKKAFETGLIKDGHVWMELLHDRNLTVHTYDESKASEMINRIAELYFPALHQLKSTFERKLHEN